MTHFAASKFEASQLMIFTHFEASNEANLVLRMCICVCMCVRTGVHACILTVKECRRLPEF